MARVKLSEYRAKSLFMPGYAGVGIALDSLDSDIERLDDSELYIIKVDQGIKKRGKQGLIRLNVAKADAPTAIKELAKKGFSRFIAEPMFVHNDDEEQYLSIERTREGMVISHSPHGGVDIEEHSDSVKQYTPENVPLLQGFVEHIITVMNAEHMSFVEINPLVVQGNTYTPLDAAVLVDSAGEFESSWSSSDLVRFDTPTAPEIAVAALNHNSPASFSLKILQPHGSIWLLLSGGGASITIADEAANQGKAEYIGNYGEYSGGPNTEETYLYTNAVLEALFASDTPKKALVIAGGVANFTDVSKTFRGVIKSLGEHIDELKSHHVQVFVRRGGPHETEGLAMMEAFLKQHDIYGSVHGSDTVLTNVIHEALEYIDD